MCTLSSLHKMIPLVHIHFYILLPSAVLYYTFMPSCIASWLSYPTAYPINDHTNDPQNNGVRVHTCTCNDEISESTTYCLDAARNNFFHFKVAFSSDFNNMWNSKSLGLKYTTNATLSHLASTAFKGIETSFIFPLPILFPVK